MEIIILVLVFGILMFSFGYMLGREWTPKYPFAKATQKEMQDIFMKLTTTAIENDRVNFKL